MPDEIIEDLFNTPIPPEVWHYTTLSGLDGILSSNSIWATEARFTRDESEFVHAYHVAIEFLEAIVPTDHYAARAKASTLKIVKSAFDKGALSRAKNEVYLASFSAAKDLKSQWFEYADGARGVSLAFDLRKIRPPKDLKLGITLAPCIYQREEKLKLLEVATSQLLSVAETLERTMRNAQWINGRVRDWLMVQSIYGLNPDGPAFDANLRNELHVQLYNAYTWSSFDLLRLASHCKDDSFSQEEEWRLALPRMKNKPLRYNEIEYRGSQGNIPYLASDPSGAGTSYRSREL